MEEPYYAYSTKLHSIVLYRNAIDLYKDDLLEEDIYEDWSTPLRVKYKSMYTKALLEISKFHLKRSEYDTSIETLQKLLEIDEYNELVYYLLMKCHLGNGNRTESVMIYKKCRDILKDEFGIDPCKDLQNLYNNTVHK